MTGAGHPTKPDAGRAYTRPHGGSLQQTSLPVATRNNPVATRVGQLIESHARPDRRQALIHPRFQKLLGYLVLVIYILALQWLWGWDTLLKPWLEFSLLGGLIAVLLLFLSYAVRALRLFDYFRPELSGRYAECFKLMLYHNMFNNLLPMRSGEISFPILMRRYFSVEAMRTVPALLWFRVLDLHVILSLGAVAGLTHGLIPALWGWLLILWLPLPWLAQTLRERLSRRLESSPEGRIRNLLARALTGLPADTGEFWRSWAWTWFNWVVKLIALAWVLLQFAPVSLEAAWVGAITGDLTSVLPIHAPGGFGTYEAGVVAGMTPFAVPLEPALSAAVNLHLFILASSLAGGALAWLIPTRMGRREEPST